MFVHDKVQDILININEIEAFQTRAEVPFGRVFFSWGNDSLDIQSARTSSEIRDRLAFYKEEPKRFKSFRAFPWQGREVLVNLDEIKAIALTDEFIIFYRRYSREGYEEVLKKNEAICCDKSAWGLLCEERLVFVSPLL